MRIFAVVLALSVFSNAHADVDEQVSRCADAIVETSRFLGAETSVVEADGRQLRRRVAETLAVAAAPATVESGLVVQSGDFLSYVVDDASLELLDGPELATIRRHADRVLVRREQPGTDAIYALATADSSLASRWLRLYAREKADFATASDHKVADALRGRYATRIVQLLAGSFGFGIGWQLVPVFNVPVAVPAGVLSHLLFRALGVDTAKHDLALVLTTAGIGATLVTAATSLPVWRSGVLRRSTTDEMFVTGKPDERRATSAFWNAAQLRVLQRHAADAGTPPKVPKFLVAAIADPRTGGFGLSAVAVDGVLYVTFY